MPLLLLGSLLGFAGFFLSRFPRRFLSHPCTKAVINLAVTTPVHYGTLLFIRLVFSGGSHIHASHTKRVQTPTKRRTGWGISTISKTLNHYRLTADRLDAHTQMTKTKNVPCLQHIVLRKSRLQIYIYILYIYAGSSSVAPPTQQKDLSPLDSSTLYNYIQAKIPGIYIYMGSPNTQVTAQRKTSPEHSCRHGSESAVAAITAQMWDRIPVLDPKTCRTKQTEVYLQQPKKCGIF